MDWLISTGATLHSALVVFGAIISFIAWKRVGFKAPAYIHVIAFIGGVIGAVLAYMGHASGAEHGDKAVWLIVGFPIATYFFFGFFGGGIVMAEQGLKDRERPNK